MLKWQRPPSLEFSPGRVFGRKQKLGPPPKKQGVHKSGVSPQVNTETVPFAVFFFERRTPPALENTVKAMLWSNPHKIGNIYHERL